MGIGMARDTFIKIRVTDEERKAWMASAERSGHTLSQVLRAAMTRRIARQSASREVAE